MAKVDLSNIRLGELLFGRGLITEEELSRVIEFQRANPSVTFGQAVIDLQLLSKDTVGQALQALNLLRALKK